MKLDTIDHIQALLADRQGVALVTELADGAQQLFTRADAPADIRTAIEADRSGEMEIEGRKCFVLVRNPPPRLLIVGAVHITQGLAPMAALAGYDVTVIDPRRAFATDQRFPDVHLRTDWPDEALLVLKPDFRTAIVTLTHDPKLDDPALIAALRSDAFYIGALGSRKTHAARLGRLRREGFDDAALARIHGPAGIAIGAKTPAEIAVSVLAELTARRRGVDLPPKQKQP
ncbi:putative sulfurylase large subunit (molybdopterin cytosine dinucleotide biosynthesis) [Dongia mobilis]|uniref:Putative sulfurylase large subunit (Molybdopterin cytosine dinucleotide biosynthesis) n=1 Tax=Dongia mobilis TaxID=578943 RepID=A0A4R6WV79_9PROT|nr:XdhC family protein [Dongia mobilis]TDQ83924.1 putative sulfurylase large subunit (molybdopterin cytosine dinucleotide biosynthesis) [Dongia mobilis]